MLVVGTLYVIPRSGKYHSDPNFFGKMDPYCTVIFNGEEKFTEIAMQQGKTPIWKTKIPFALRSDQITNQDTQIKFVTYDYDGKSKKQHIGSGSILLKEVTKFKENQKVIELFDSKNKPTGSITVDFVVSDDQIPIDSLNAKSDAVSKKTPVSTGTLIMRPKIANLNVEPEKYGKLHPYIVAIMGDQAYQTSIAKSAGKLASWQEALSFNLYDDEVIMVRVLDSEELAADDPICEALINIQYILESMQNGICEITINLEYRGKDAGQLTIEFELSKLVFENPVKFYSPITIPRGGYVCKKIKYTNPDNQKKTLSIITSESPKLVQIRNPALTLNAKSYTEIRLKLFAPQDSEEVEVRVDVVVEELNEIEETLIFRIRST